MQHCSSGSMEKDMAIQGYVCGLPCSRQGSPKIFKNPISWCCMWYWWGHAVSTLLRLLQVSKYQGMAFVGKAGWFSYGLWPSSTNHPQSAFPAGGSARRQPTTTGMLSFMELVPLHPAPLALPEAAGLSLHSVSPVVLGTAQS